MINQKIRAYSCAFSDGVASSQRMHASIHSALSQSVCLCANLGGQKIAVARNGQSQRSLMRCEAKRVTTAAAVALATVAPS